MKFRVIPVTPFQQNCTLMWCEETARGVVIDPGGDLDRVRQVAREEGVILEKILLTHGHLDHAGAVAVLARDTGLPVEGPHRDDEFWIEGLPLQSQRFGFAQADRFTPDRWLEDGDRVTFGNQELEVLHCPGHTPGHVVFYHRSSGLAQVGDVLFNGSIGRTDFPRGDYNQLIASIREKLFRLGEDIRFIPGHGPMSTFGHERRTNPFVSDHRG
ncbi:Glyoxylase, beta-lactamase superfamily II [Marinobacter daqiaonensis]|uniref:Glyoxylase, beta-lactamase superfamily II n=1 Tax=Marinobacter daqiaonensis TaxID=650891 RepID=A0A1I6I5V3_9GAMM|nr:MBL fold metallo-hydrolase [Marinobacter daqiaonensis]SFR62092.1 Glyoxylase, beta-lactamase superfamily II [Marinobacter daqiaonensis]